MAGIIILSNTFVKKNISYIILKIPAYFIAASVGVRGSTPLVELLQYLVYKCPSAVLRSLFGIRLVIKWTLDTGR